MAKRAKTASKKVARKKVTKAKKGTKATKAAKKKSTKVKARKAAKRTATQSGKPAPPQLTFFPILSQRPIAHKRNHSAADEARTRYNEEELREFESLILEKLEKARAEYRILKETLNRENDSGTDSTSGGNTKVLEDGAETAEKENLSQLAARQQKYITNLENALVRIKNGTYGICTVTGKLIPKERLIAVPHTTQTIEAKMMKQD